MILCFNPYSTMAASSDIDERTLQEIYFPAFRKAVQEANVGAVSYPLPSGSERRHAGQGRASSAQRE